jgi:hypothetical protein
LSTATSAPKVLRRFLTLSMVGAGDHGTRGRGRGHDSDEGPFSPDERPARPGQ